jgi:hypothetical protein
MYCEGCAQGLVLLLTDAPARVDETQPMVIERMRWILPMAVAFAVLLSSTGARADGTWCAHYGTGFGGMNCGFYSFEQCRAAVSGVGGFCQANASSAHARATKQARRPDRRY